jgi:hypothetical protein
VTVTFISEKERFDNEVILALQVLQSLLASTETLTGTCNGTKVGYQAHALVPCPLQDHCVHSEEVEAGKAEM